MTAADLLTGRFVRIGEGHTVAEAIGILFDPGASALRELVVVVLRGDGGYLGLVEPRTILESFGPELLRAGDDPAAQVEGIRRRLAAPVGEIARRDIPSAGLRDNLAVLLTVAARTDAGVIPVFEGGEFAGVAPVTAIFDALCKATIAADEGALPFMGGGAGPG